MRVTAVLTPAAEGGSRALNPETGAVSEGETVEQAVGNPREAVKPHLEQFPFSAPTARALTLVTSFDAADA